MTAAEPHPLPFRRRLRGMEDGECLLSLTVYYAAPALAGLKPSALFSPGGIGGNLTSLLPACGERLGGAFGLRLASLGGHGPADRPLLFAYDPSLLGRALANHEAAALLAARGYDVATGRLEDCLNRLRRECAGPGFPHEIGVFLGYPPRDVGHFMAGAVPESAEADLDWRPFGDLEAARLASELHRRARRLAARIMTAGADWTEAGQALRRRAWPRGFAEEAIRRAS